MANDKASRELRRFQKEIESLFSEAESVFDNVELATELPSIDFQVTKDSLTDFAKGLLQSLGQVEAIWDECVDKAVAMTIPELSQALDAAMESDIWPWPSGARDIVDTGALKDSKRITYNKSTNILSIQYNEPYADLVQYGGYITSGYNPKVSIYIPPRPWVDAVLDGGYGITRFPFKEIVEERAFEIFSRKTIFK